MVALNEWINYSLKSRVLLHKVTYDALVAQLPQFGTLANLLPPQYLMTYMHLIHDKSQSQWSATFAKNITDILDALQEKIVVQGAVAVRHLEEKPIQTFGVAMKVTRKIRICCGL